MAKGEMINPLPFLASIDPLGLFLGILILGVFCIVSSGLIHIFLPAGPHKEPLILIALRIGALSILLNTILAWRSAQALSTEIFNLPVLVIAGAAPLLMVLAIGLCLRFTANWVQGRAPGTIYPPLSNAENMTGEHKVRDFVDTVKDL